MNLNGRHIDSVVTQCTLSTLSLFTGMRQYSSIIVLFSNTDCRNISVCVNLRFPPSDGSEPGAALPAGADRGLPAR